MSKSANQVTLEFEADAKIVLTRILYMLNQCRKERRLPPFVAHKVALGHVEAEADKFSIKLIYSAADTPPQASIILSHLDACNGSTQLELALLTQYLIERQSVVCVDWPFYHSRLSAEEFSRNLSSVIQDAVGMADREDFRSAAVESLFKANFPADEGVVNAAANQKVVQPRQPRLSHGDFVAAVFSNFESGPIAAATRATDTIQDRSVPYRLAAWALAFIVALFCLPLALPLIADNLRNGENVRACALGIGAMGLFTALEFSMA